MSLATRKNGYGMMFCGKLHVWSFSTYDYEYALFPTLIAWRWVGSRTKWG